MASDPKDNLDRVLTIELARVTEYAALSAARLIGRGDEKAADQAAVDGMRRALNNCHIKGTIVIGEGERDEAPMLYIGEKVGTGEGPEVDIALDPLECTTLTAKAMPGAMAVVAVAQGGTLLHAPDTYMQKIAIGPGYPKGIVDLDADPVDNMKALAKAKGVAVHQLAACILDRPRHEDMIAKVRSTGASVHLIPDGDIAGVIHCTDSATGIDIYMGLGGAPEGVLAAAALRCIGGQIQGRLHFRNDDERERAAKAGITNLDRKYCTDEMASGDVMFAATGVTTGSLLRGIEYRGDAVITHTIVMRSLTGTVRVIEARHRADLKSF
jgi:fructose-1,6-bisphosphatase II / sedoheptulose-1,7-bisphosphatase